MKSARFEFTKRDFEWNNALSPSIYLQLKGAKVVDSKFYLFRPSEKADELIIIMNRVDEKDILFEKLMHGEITKDECFAMGKQLAETFDRAGKRKIDRT